MGSGWLLAGALAADPDLGHGEARLDEVLASNLCRCTGYVGIRRATVAAARRMRDRGLGQGRWFSPGTGR
jgi:aerobic-type carbon monoxide dehydrogenase small subunit (CoxS/CutS family)